MVSGKKITKKQLKQPDEFISFTDHAFRFVASHSKKFAIGGTAVLLIVLAVVFYQMWEKNKEGEADQQFNQALQVYQQVSSPYREEAPPEYKKALEKFDEVAKKFSGTSAGKLALLYKGDLDLKLGEFEEAAKTYQTFLSKMGKEKLYSLLAMDGLGYAYEGQKKYDQALETYQKMIATDAGFESGEAYLKIGRCYEKLGKNKEAAENYRSFLKASPKSLMANVVSRKVSFLEK